MKKILIIDDDNYVVKLFKKIAKEGKCRLISASTAKDALQKVEQYYNDIILVLIDLKFPLYDCQSIKDKMGIILTKQLRKKFPFLFIVGMLENKNINKKIIEKWEKAGVYEIIDKQSENFCERVGFLLYKIQKENWKVV